MNFISPTLVLFSLFMLLQAGFGSTQGITLFPMEVLQKKLSQITDRILSWSPFGISNSKVTTKYNDEYEVDFNSGNTNLTIRRHYFYGCECRNFFCSCCAHIEVAKTSLNHTGKFI